MASSVLVGIRKLLAGTSIPTSQSSYRPFSTLAVDGRASATKDLRRLSSMVPLQPIYGHSGDLTFRKIRDTSLQAVCCFYSANDFRYRYAPPIIQRLVHQFPPVKAFHFVIEDDNDEDLSDDFTMTVLNISSLPMFHFYQNGEKVEELAGDFIRRFKTVLEKLYNPQKVGTKAQENVMREGIVGGRNKEEQMIGLMD
ncbi:putative thioredoxin-like protein [Rosa chinensis]|uniref:Putative thioredoxin-like protein n=1 Tax=Rosa chinensis TaxID=74649 RepID=A0A2P6RGL9_ROSCH|nr:uncharacterized protein LOC112195391 isoform X1 [Rosa chinensis]PRQ45580.1 putative thioredoxin-like protein [Rosa chinensis]